MADTGKKATGNESAAGARTELLKRALLKIESLEGRLAEAEKVKNEPIAIIGMACRLPAGANDVESYWELLESGVDAISEPPPTRWKLEDYFDTDRDAPGKAYTMNAGFIDDVDEFDASFFGISPREAEQMDPQQRWMMQVSWQALENAGLSPDQLVGSPTGVFVGMTGSDFLFLQMGHGSNNIDTYLASGTSHAVAAGRLSYALGLRGPALTVDTACSSALLAVHLACASLRSHECDTALAGGVLLCLSPDGFVSACKAQLLSPDGHCKTFDDSADGYVRAEGCAMITLKRLSDAERDGDNILAVIKGSACNQDGRSGGLTAPSGTAQEMVIRDALANAGIGPLDVTYVETHGTGTSLGDPIEVQALASVYGQGRDKDKPLVIGSVKSNIGHTEGLAGVAGLIKLVVALQRERIPGDLHFQTPNSHIPWEDFPLVVADRNIDWPKWKEQLIGGVSSFGFSGTNVHMIVEQAPIPELAVNDEERPLHLLTLSARREAGLLELAERYGESLRQQASENVGNFCFTANTGRSHFEHRATVIGADEVELAAGLKSIVNGDQGGAIVGGKIHPHGSFNVGFVFPGEGCQAVGMGRDLFLTQPVFRKVLEECDTALQDCLDESLLSVMYPADNKDTQSLIDDPRYSQPALFALQWALIELWESIGVTPSVVLGRGCGELAAASAAGVIDYEDGLKLAAERGRLLAECGDNGSVAVVKSGVDDVREIIADVDTVGIASVDASSSVVISGSKAGVDDVLKKLDDHEVAYQRLGMTLPVQSSLLAGTAEAISSAAAKIDHNEPHIDLISTLTGKAVVSDMNAAYWGEQVCNTLQMTAAIRTLRGRGCHAIIELGPRGSLLGMVRRGLQSSTMKWLESIDVNGNDWQKFLSSVGSLYVGGMDIEWPGLDAGYSRRKVILPTYPFERQRYAIPSAKPDRQLDDVSAWRHPLVGRRLRSPRVEDLIWESRFDAESGVLDDYRYFDSPVVPAAAYVEAAMTAAAEVFPGRSIAVRKFLHEATLPISEPLNVQTVASTPASESSRIEVFSRTANGAEEDADWTRHSCCAVEVAGEFIATAATDELRSEWEARCREKISGSQFYEQLVDSGQHAGTSFQVIDSLSRCDGEAVARIRTSGNNLTTLVAACSHLVQIAIPGMPTLRPGVPLAALRSFENLWVDADVPESLYVHVTIRDGSGVEDAVGDVQLYDLDGRQVGDLTGVVHGAFAAADMPLANERRLRNWMYGIDWEEANVPTTPSGAAQSRHWLFLADEPGCAQEHAKRLVTRGERVSIATAAEVYARTADDSYTVNPDSADDLNNVLRVVRDSTPDADLSILYFWGMDVSLPAVDDHSPGDEIALACHRLLNVARAAMQADTRARLTVVTRGAQPVDGAANESILVQAPFVGIQRVLANELAELGARTIDLDPARDGAADSSLLTTELLAGDDEESQIAFRRGKRYIARLARCEFDESDEVAPNLDLGSGGYLVTGGLGGIGLTVADWLVRRGARQLFLMGRSGASKQAQKRIAEFEAVGVKVNVVSADVSDADELRSAFETIDNSSVPLRGVFHAAGVIDDALLENQDLEHVAKVMRPKVDGSWNLHTLTADRELDHFVLFSAAAAVFGNPGQTNYAAANLFVDAMAHHRKSLGLPALSINWGAWAEVGMAASLGSTAHGRWAQLGVGDIVPRDGANAMELAMLTGRPQLAVMPINWAQWRRAFPGGKLPPFTSRLMQATTAEAAKTGPSISNLRELLAGADEERAVYLGEYVTRQLAVLLGLVVEEIDMKQPVSELGFDSLMATNLKTRIEADLAIDVPVAALLDGPNSHDLVDRLLAVHDQSGTSTGASTEMDDDEWEEGAL